MTAEQERSTLIQTLGAMRTDRGRRHGRHEGDRTALHVERDCRPRLWRVDPQSAHVHACMVRRSGSHCSRKIVVGTCVASQRDRFVPWITVFGEQSDEDEQIDNIDDYVGKFYAYLVSFTTDAPNRIVRNSGEGNGLEAA